MNNAITIFPGNRGKSARCWETGVMVVKKVQRVGGEGTRERSNNRRVKEGDGGIVGGEEMKVCVEGWRGRGERRRQSADEEERWRGQAAASWSGESSHPRSPLQ